MKNLCFLQFQCITPLDGHIVKMNLPFSASYRALNSLLHQTEPLQPASPVLSSWTRAHRQANTHTTRAHTHIHTNVCKHTQACRDTGPQQSASA